VDEAIATLRAMEPFGIELVEQPIPRGDPDGLRRIRDAVDIPLIADESALDADDLPALVGAVDGVNVKLMKCGGLAAARRMAEAARSLGLRVMIGCFIESAIAVTAAAHLSPLADYADLDGNLLIDDDPFEGVSLDADAHLVLPAHPGLGVVPRGAVPSPCGRAPR
jgi:L-alanine-DL-glutamate epimerase-like enolase superfamily enzyme